VKTVRIKTIIKNEWNGKPVEEVRKRAAVRKDKKKKKRAKCLKGARKLNSWGERQKPEGKRLEKGRGREGTPGAVGIIEIFELKTRNH